MNLLTTELYKEKLTWLVWFLIVIVFFQAVLIFLAAYFGGSVEPFVLFSFQPSRIFMLVLGIMSAYRFLDYYYHLGQTRKRYFKSSLAATSLLTLTMLVLFFFVSLVEKGVFRLFGLPGSMLSAEEGTNIVNENGHLGIHMQFSTEGVGLLDSPTLFILFFAIQLLFFYGVGWLISVGFYRYGWLIGLGFVLLALVFLSLNEWIWSNPVREAIPIWFIYMGSVAITMLALRFVYRFVKKTPIKIK
ncbi:hypothetical protein ABC345_04280 [Shouchella sp. 1P09AA]|uniref:hypothetical protein n=1 Tax=unclassified Shouchella TaxID=2893065 RepID=UPI0039A26D45